MNPYQEGDSGNALCGRCGKMVITTYMHRDVPFSDGKVIVKAILVGVCNTCCQVVEYPAQSIPAICQALRGHHEPGESATLGNMAQACEGGNAKVTIHNGDN